MNEKNPHLPDPPADGKHSWSAGPTDLGGNHRCTFCGAYQGSPEGETICVGEFRESGKMRRWAEMEWQKDKLLDGGPVRKILVVHRRTAVGDIETGCLFIASPEFSITLNCGCERSVDMGEGLNIEEGSIREASCLNENCLRERMEQHRLLNTRS